MRLRGPRLLHGSVPGLLALPLLAALVAMAVPVEATVWYVPGVANADGRNGTHFSSDVRILNRGTATILAAFELVPSGGDPPAPVSRSIAPGETFVSLNVLAALWGFKGAGVLKVTVDETVTITARTYNDADPSGTYGTALTPLAHEDLLEAGDTAHAAWVSESPDSGKDYRTNLAVFLALPDSSVDVVLFDAAGQEKGRTNVAGGPLMLQTSASALAPAGLPVGRAEFRVLAGKAAAYVPVVDNVTGDGISIPAELPLLTETRVVLNGAARAAGREGTFFRTDVRLFNLSDAASTVTVTPLSVPGIGAPATVSLAAGELREVTDVLGTLFAAPEGSTGSLLFVSSDPVVVLGRTSNVHRDGTPGTYGALQRGRRESAFLGPASDAVMIGLAQGSGRPGYRSNVGFLAGSDGTSLKLTLRSRTGQLIGTNDGVTLGAYGWTQPALDSLFPGVAIPADSVLEVVPRSGRVDVYASVIDNVTGDPVINAAEELKPYACPLPEIGSFTAVPDTLAAAGNVVLSWATSGADTLSGVPGAAGADGSVTVPVTASGSYRLQATNGCGSVAATVGVVVGPPTVQLVSGGSGSPGELVTLELGNVAVPSDTGSVLVTFPDGIAFRTRARGTAGSSLVRFIVPFLQDALAPSGYRQGPCTITVDAFGPASSPLPFTITPLVPPGDPVTGYAAFLDTAFGEMGSALARAAGVADFQPAFSAVTGEVSAYEALLRKVAQDLASAESTVTPIDLPSDEVPSPGTTTVTRADLGLFLALWRNVQGSTGQLRRAGALEAGGSCLSGRNKVVEACLHLQALSFDSIITDFFTSLLGALGIRDDGTVVTTFANGVSVLLSSYLSALETARGACPALPVWLKNFIADPDTVSIDETQDVKVKAYMEFLVTSDMLATYLADKITQRYLAKYASALPEKVRARWISAATPLLRAQTASLRQSIAAWVKGHGGIKSPTATEQVGACDLELGLTRIYPRTTADFNLSYVQGEDDFFVKGYRRGTAVFFAVPKPHHFLLPVSVEQAYSNPAPAFAVPTYTLPLRVGGTAGFTVSGIQLQLATADGVVDSYSFPFPRTAVTRKMPFTFRAPGAFAGNIIQARSIDDLTYSATVSGLAAPPQATFTSFAYSFLYENPKGSLSLSGGLLEAYLTVTRTVDGGNAATLVDKAWSRGVSASDSFTSRASSYDVSSSQRLIDGAAAVGSSVLLYVFRPVKGKVDPDTAMKWSGSGPTGGLMSALSSAGAISRGRVSPAAAPAPLVAATNGGGVYLSPDGGDSWHAATTGPADAVVTALARDPSNDLTLYAGTKTGGIFVSADGGESWASLGLSGVLTNAVAPDPLDSAVVYALQYRTSGGLQKSLDAGKSWSARATGLPASAIPNALAFAPGSSSRLYLATTKGLYASADSAGSFTPAGGSALGSCATQVVAVASTPPALVAAGCASDLWRSRDGGATWESLRWCSAGAGTLAVQPDGTLLASATRSVCRSSDLGSTWTVLPTGTTDQVSGVGFSNDSGALFALTTSGLLRSRDGGATFSQASAGITATWISQVLVDRGDSKLLYAIDVPSTTSTCGRPTRSADGGTTWTRMESAAAVVPSVCAMAQEPSGALVFAGAAGDVPKAARSADGGTTWVELAVPVPPYSGETAFYDALSGAPPASPLYVGTNTKLYSSASGGGSWTTAGPWPPLNWVSFPLAASPVDPADLVCNVVMTGLYRTKDGGASWTALPGPSDLGSTNQVAFDRIDPALIHAGTSKGVYRSADGGATWVKTAQTASTASVVTDPVASGTVYAGRGYAVGGGGGVFRSTDRGDTWTQVGKGFTVGRLALSADGKTICAATTGSGVKCQPVGLFAGRPPAGSAGPLD